MLCKHPHCNMPIKSNEMVVIEKSGPERGQPVLHEGKEINWTAKYNYCGPDHYVEDMTRTGAWGSMTYNLITLEGLACMNLKAIQEKHLEGLENLPEVDEILVPGRPYHMDYYNYYVRLDPRGPRAIVHKSTCRYVGKAGHALIAKDKIEMLGWLFEHRYELVNCKVCMGE